MINFHVEDFKDLVSDMNKVIGSTVSFKRHVYIHDAFNTTWIKLAFKSVFWYNDSTIEVYVFGLHWESHSVALLFVAQI